MSVILKGCASVFNTHSFNESSCSCCDESLSSSNKRYKYLSVSAKKKLFKKEGGGRVNKHVGFFFFWKLLFLFTFLVDHPNWDNMHPHYQYQKIQN